jgi:hypothetical protein
MSANLNICLCEVCNCKKWKTDLENKNNQLESENNMLKQENDHLKSKFENFEMCEVCDAAEQYMSGCRRCDITLCKKCYNILYESEEKDDTIMKKCADNYSYYDDMEYDIGQKSLLAKYKKEDAGIYLCKHIQYYS